jgi:predicted alpha/beta-fold hydrolase
MMTVAAAFWRRNFPHLPLGMERFFDVEPGAKLLGHCHWQATPKDHATIVLVHGLEGSSDSGYMLGIAEKAYQTGFNAVRLNQRNCGGSEKLTTTLYNSGLSGDYRSVLHELTTCDALSEIFFCGYSMGGNLVLKMAGELGERAPKELRGVAAVCPSLDLAACADALELPANYFYHRHFVQGLKRRYRRKARQLPHTYSLTGLPRIRSLRQFDNIITAPRAGYRDAADYYYRASALRVAGQIRVPTLIITAKDDPFVPANSFADPAITGNPDIQVATTVHGGHCGFVSNVDGPERFWAETRVVEFCLAQLR